MPFPELPSPITDALVVKGYDTLTPVQASVLEPEARDRDLVVSAQTGSGKTVAFGLAMAGKLLGDGASMPPAGLPLALIIAPTRELALQVSRELTWLMAHAGARIVTCVGGMDARREQRALAAGCHFVVATPGRLRDHLERGNLDLSALKAVVLDEADEMLDLGFREELETLLDATNAEARRTLLFSATIARGIAMLAKNYQRDAVRIDTTSATEPHGDIDYRAMRVSPGDTERAVVNVLRYFEAGGALVFCATREAVRHLHASLRERGFHAVGLSGEMNQRERNDALQSLRDGHAKVCVATDVAARGLDIDDLPHVINYELPHTAEDYIHRIGRTGRAGKSGDATSLFAPEETQRLADIEKLIKRKIERVEITGFAELAQVRESAPPSNRGHKREHLERAREKAREHDRALTLDGSRPAGRELPSPVAHVPRLDPRLPRLDFDPNKPYVSKTVAINVGAEKPAPTRPQRPVAALLGGLGKK